MICEKVIGPEINTQNHLHFYILLMKKSKEIKDLLHIHHYVKDFKALNIYLMRPKTAQKIIRC